MINARHICDRHDRISSCGLILQRILAVSFVSGCLLTGCAMTDEPAVRMSRAEAEWRQGCRVRNGMVEELDNGELVCRRERRRGRPDDGDM